MKTNGDGGGGDGGGSSTKATKIERKSNNGHGE